MLQLKYLNHRTKVFKGEIEKSQSFTRASQLDNTWSLDQNLEGPEEIFSMSWRAKAVNRDYSQKNSTKIEKELKTFFEKHIRGIYNYKVSSTEDPRRNSHSAEKDKHSQENIIVNKKW